jgi:hypothetical protein
MHVSTLRRIRELVRRGQFVVTQHVWRKLWAERLAWFDLEDLVLEGRITARQREEVSGEWKYVIEGANAFGERAATVVKFSTTGKLVFITIYRL